KDMVDCPSTDLPCPASATVPSRTSRPLAVFPSVNAPLAPRPYTIVSMELFHIGPVGKIRPALPGEGGDIPEFLATDLHGHSASPEVHRGGGPGDQDVTVFVQHNHVLNTAVVIDHEIFHLAGGHVVLERDRRSDDAARAPNAVSPLDFHSARGLHLNLYPLRANRGDDQAARQPASREQTNPRHVL